MERIWLPHYTDNIPHDIETPDIAIPALLDRAAERWGEQTATVFFGKQTTYRQLVDGANRFAAALAQLGVGKGDRVALLLPNSPQTIIAYYGALKAGAIVVQNNPLYTDPELEFQLKDCGATTIVILDIFYGRIKRMRAKTALQHIIVTSVKEALPFPLNLLYPIKAKKEGHDRRVDRDPSVHWFQRLLANASETPPDVSIDPASDLALLQYTGGTTGVAKGAMLTHRNLIANTIQIRHWFARVEEGKEVWLSVLPFFHVFGMTVCMNFPIYIGARIVLMPQFDLKLLLKNFVKQRVTMFPGVPAMYIAITNFPGIERHDLSSIKFCMSGAAPLPGEVERRFESLTGATLIEGYGLTEASPVTHANPLYGTKKIGSIGMAIPSTHCKVVDLETGDRELGIGEEGDLCIQGPQVMRGYWNNEEETAQVLRNDWLHTGDVVRIDEEGYVFIVERKKDLILTGGLNVYPREIEEVLFEHPAVLEAAVVSAPHEKMGEVSQAHVVLKEGQSATQEELVEFCTKSLASYKVPRTIYFRSELPKSLIGKVLRRVLQEETQQGSASVSG